MDKLLQDAIADAKAVRETALANAKLALEEAFTPHLKSMLSKKLQAEMENEDEESHDEGYHGEEEEEKDESVSEEADSSGIGASDNKDPDDEAGDTSGIGQGPESEGGDEDGGDEDENLEDAPDQPMGEGMEDEEMEDEAHHEGMHDEEDEDKKDEGMHDEEMEDEDDDIAEVLKQLEAEMANEEDEPKEGYHDDEEDKEEKEEGAHMDDEGMHDDDMDEEIDLDEIIKALTEEEVNEEDEEEKKEEAMVPAAELEEYKQTVQYLKDKLSEVNLLNAKLLYTNKLFRSRNVSEEQKMKVIEQFDRAANVREVKLVYTTFAESIARKPVNESAKRVSKASKPVASTESKKPIIGENTDFKSRMKKLANII